MEKDKLVIRTARIDKTNVLQEKKRERQKELQRSFDKGNNTTQRINQLGEIIMLHAGILMSVILPSMVIVGQIGLLITELMEERMHARELVVVKGNGRA